MTDGALKGFVIGVAFASALWIVCVEARSDTFREMSALAHACIEHIQK